MVHIVDYIFIILEVLFEGGTRKQYPVLHLENGSTRLVLDHKCVSAGFDHVHMEEEWVTNVKRDVLEVELLCRCNTWGFISEERHDNLVPVVCKVKIFLSLDSSQFCLVHWFWIIYSHALFSDISILGGLSYKIGSSFVFFKQEREQAAHLLRSPVGEGTANDRQAIVKQWTIIQVRLVPFHSLGVVLDGLRVLVRS